MTPGLALAAEAPGGQHTSEFLFLAQIALLVFVGRALGEIMQRIGQPAVIGQLLGGLLLGPSVFGLIWPDGQHLVFPNNPAQKSMIDAVSHLGVLLLLLLAGMETDLKLVRKVGRPAVGISVAGICLPFACGFALGELMPDSMLPDAGQRLMTALFLGTALSISSVKIVAIVVREMNFTRRNVGQLILASAVIDDTIGWIIIAITFSLATSGTIDAMSIGRSVFGTLIFMGLALTLGRRLVFTLIRAANDNLIGEVPVISVIVLIMAVMAMTTDLIGVHTVLGAFVAGILVGGSPILTRRIDMQLRGLISGLFMPVFFGLAGLSADLTVLREPRLLLFTVLLVAIASIGKFAGAFAGGRFGRLSMRESLALACGMNARGSTEVIVASIGLSMGVLNQDLFTAIVTMAVVTTMAMPPMLRAALARLPLNDDEKRRLDREAFEATGFVANLERILLAVDDSPNAKFASRIAGLLAGGHGKPTTVLHVGPQDIAQTEQPHETSEAHVESGAAATAAKESDKDAPPDKVNILTKSAPQGPAKHVAAEAGKGYDLLIVGVDPTSGKDGALSPGVVQIAAEFEGPLAIVSGRGRHLDNPKDAPLRILAPVTGTDVSRRAAEVAITLARALGAHVGALYVTDTLGPRAGPVDRALATRRHEESILKDFVETAERIGAPAGTAVRINAPPEDAILMHAERAGFDLVVLGVNQRPGETLFFGRVAASVLARSQVSVLLISTGAAASTTASG